jgi:hypothetical protein
MFDWKPGHLAQGQQDSMIKLELKNIQTNHSELSWNLSVLDKFEIYLKKLFLLKNPNCVCEIKRENNKETNEKELVITVSLDDNTISTNIDQSVILSKSIPKELPQKIVKSFFNQIEKRKKKK